MAGKNYGHFGWRVLLLFRISRLVENVSSLVVYFIFLNSDMLASCFSHSEISSGYHISEMMRAREYYILIVLDEAHTPIKLENEIHKNILFDSLFSLKRRGDFYYQLEASDPSFDS